jgi:hypothetical protein
VPAGSTILDARLSLRDISPAGVGGLSSPGFQLTGTQTFNIHRVTASWTEGTGNGTAGSGTALGGGANFSNIGNSFNATVTGTIQFVNPAAGPRYSTFTSTALATDVADWFSGTESNFGWMIKSATETGANTVSTIKWFESSEGPNKPSLVITFRRPLP